MFTAAIIYIATPSLKVMYTVNLAYDIVFRILKFVLASGRIHWRDRNRIPRHGIFFWLYVNTGEMYFSWNSISHFIVITFWDTASKLTLTAKIN